MLSLARAFCFLFRKAIRQKAQWKAKNYEKKGEYMEELLKKQIELVISIQELLNSMIKIYGIELILKKMSELH